MALEVGVDGVGRAAALGDRLDDGRGADPDVAGAEHARPAGLERDRVGLEPALLGRLGPLASRARSSQVRALADGQQDAVAGDRELGAGRRLRAAAAGRVGRAEAPSG